jgi:hypothetical protein
MLPLCHSTESFNSLLFGNNEGLHEGGGGGWVGNIVGGLLNEVRLSDEVADNSWSYHFTRFPALYTHFNIS